MQSSPEAFLAELRMQDALELLETELFLKEIAQRLFYEHQPNFSRSFRRVYGVTAKEYRKRLKQKAEDAGEPGCGACVHPFGSSVDGLLSPAVRR
jgi:AraC-like DNA-binding protein